MKIFQLRAHKFFLVVIFFMVLNNGRSLPVMPHRHMLTSLQERETTFGNQEEGAKEEMVMEVFPFGSSLPDCSHACGPCSPCKRVMVSFKCSIAESCPVVYRCMCKGKYYHVPSN
ncbi:Epidermal patterning factor [Quillaja saponaria]|uniref:Epidermal patterning factor-like protein n=1 Tax=Quillaja saponaria TaxID=32244 RepID=A0AAD7L021_QUISA|nr:Epidermal patterning factor [Quillaja saponaria]